MRCYINGFLTFRLINFGENMDDFQSLIRIIERLLAPNGCPWDREQTLQSMRGALLEETSEVLEAIHLDENQKIEEELGDLLFNVVFLCKLAEKENRFTIQNVLHHINAKLIRRHPHIFGEAAVKNTEEVLQQWEEIKKAEKKQAQASVLDGIPKELPALSRAQKILKKIHKAGYPFPSTSHLNDQNEEQMGQALSTLVIQANQQGIDAEQALRKFLALLEKEFRKWEAEPHSG